MENNITIGIEGLVGAGKTSICRELLKKVPNSIILHGGNLYRGIVFALMSSGADMNKIMHGTDKPIDIKQMMDMLNLLLLIFLHMPNIYLFFHFVYMDHIFLFQLYH